ncbi:hypothetical protein QUF72_14010 [Desulfobacterales bacterium HSG2]|nr:hypothetical protein [Desulfobacterales bacterium HSG2]
MSANPKESIETPDTKTDSLENILEQFIASANRLVIRMEESDKAFKDGIRADTQKFKDGIRTDTQKFKDEIRDDTRNSKDEIRDDTRKFKEEIMDDTGEFKAEMKAVKKDEIRDDTRKFKEELMDDIGELKAEMKAFKKDEIRDDTRKFKEEVISDIREPKAEMKAFKKDEIRDDAKKFGDDIRSDTRKMIREMNRKWAEVSDKMGTMDEDVVAPNMPTIIRKYFGDSDLSFFGIRIRKRKKEDRGTPGAFDVIAVSKKNFYVVEVKSEPSPEDVDTFVGILSELGEYFPESKGKRVVPVFYSLYINGDLLKHLTRNRIYAMGLGEETMDLLNFEAVSELGRSILRVETEED